MPATRNAGRRGHSLGGCSACRKRHIRCDQVRPTCRACQITGVHCEGYQTKLKWIAVQSNGVEDGTVDNNPTDSAARSHLYTEQDRLSMSIALQSQLASRSIDQILLEIDASVKELGSLRGQSIAVGPFGVMGFDSRLSSPTKNCNWASSLSLDNPVHNPSGSEPIPCSATTEYLDLLNDLDGLLGWSELFDPDTHLDREGYSNCTDYRIADKLDLSRCDDINAQQTPMTPSQPEPSDTGFSLKEIQPWDAQTLLKHFKSKIIFHMFSFPFDEKPYWETLNVNAAMLTLASLTYAGTERITHAMMANLLALLAMSAGQMARLDDSQTTVYWQGIGSTAYQQALQAQSRDLKSTKYKEQLMALSAMLAFAILFDHQDEARAYQLDIERLLRLRAREQRVVSRKAKLLHHIYSWNKIVGESSFVLCTYDRGEVDTHINGITEADDLLGLDQNTTMRASQTQGDQEPNTDTVHLLGSKEDAKTIHQELYGVSETWLSLVSQTTRLANIMDSLQSIRNEQDQNVMNVLEQRKQHLEDMIWNHVAESLPLNSSFWPQSQSDSGERLPDHPRIWMLRALNLALVIFFHRRIRRVSPWRLQQYVSGVSKALQNFDDACNLFGVEGPGSPWPAFMAGCEAMSQLDRDFFSHWVNRAFLKTGFNRFKTIEYCMQEVWKKRGSPEERNISHGSAISWSWVDVCREQNIYVMLS